MKDINTGVADFPVSMIHSCSYRIPKCLPNDEIFTSTFDPSHILLFTQSCIAYPTINNNSTFTCYDLKPNNTNTTVYELNTLKNTTVYDCNYDENWNLMDGEVPFHRYSITIAQKDYRP